MSDLPYFDIDDLRNQIDKIDSNLVSLFEVRMEIILKIDKYKKDNNMKILNQAREEEIIKKNLNLVKNKDFCSEVEQFFKSVMEISRGFQTKI